MLHFSDKFNLLGYLVTLQILFGCSAIDAGENLFVCW